MRTERQTPTMDTEESVWSQLPHELVERVLSFLSVPDLCRFRVVCKKWNEIVCRPSFHDLCDEHNNSNRVERNTYLFVTRRWGFGLRGRGNLMHSWTSFLDVDAMRWYNSNPIKDEGTQFLAMDDGLICESDANFQKFIISDLIHANRARRVLPKPPVPCSHADVHPTIVMAVDPGARSFKVVVIDNTGQAPTRMFVYESSSNQWRALRNPPYLGQLEIAWSTIIIREVLYITIGHSRPQRLSGQFVVFRYNLQEDLWGDVIRASVPPGKLIKRPPQFVVSSDRLFIMMGVSEHSNSQPDPAHNELVLEVREVLIVANETRTVAAITFSDLKKMFDEVSEDFHVAYGVPCVNSEGLCTSITLVSSLSGKVVSYDLVSGSAVVLPALEEVGGPDDDDDIPPLMICQGKRMKLSLRILTSQDLG